MHNLSASIVAYKNPVPILAKTIHSFLTSARNSTLYLIDNSPNDQLRCLAYDPRIVYIFNNKNIGFGAGHNISLNKVLNQSKYHLVLNPDVYFEGDVLPVLFEYMEANPHIGQVMPKVLYPDGRLQYLCKLLPKPRTLLLRRFFNFLKKQLEQENFHYELQFTEYDKIMNVPFLSGCFMFLRTEALKKVGLFDERFFLYSEDADLTRRIHKHFKTVYYPDTKIYHYHARGSYKEFKLMLCNIQSAIRYFNKWGWWTDDERDQFNQNVLLQHARP